MERVLFLHKAELGFFHFLEIVTSWLVPSRASRRSPLRKTGFFMQVRELKIQRKIQAVLYEVYEVWVHPQLID
jgi:hypothetical protein